MTKKQVISYIENLDDLPTFWREGSSGVVMIFDIAVDIRLIWWSARTSRDNKDILSIHDPTKELVCIATTGGSWKPPQHLWDLIEVHKLIHRLGGGVCTA